MQIQIRYSNVDRRYYIRLMDGSKEIAELGNQIKKPTKKRAFNLYQAWSKKNIKVK